jgi:hypothetical protein
MSTKGILKQRKEQLNIENIEPKPKAVLLIASDGMELSGIFWLAPVKSPSIGKNPSGNKNTLQLGMAKKKPKNVRNILRKE